MTGPEPTIFSHAPDHGLLQRIHDSPEQLSFPGSPIPTSPLPVREDVRHPFGRGRRHSLAFRPFRPNVVRRRLETGMAGPRDSPSPSCTRPDQQGLSVADVAADGIDDATTIRPLTRNGGRSNAVHIMAGDCHVAIALRTTPLDIRSLCKCMHCRAGAMEAPRGRAIGLSWHSSSSLRALPPAARPDARTFMSPSTVRASKSKCRVLRPAHQPA